jgi:hypothetical protein
MLTCDGVMTVYVDGVKQNNKTSGYETAQNYTIPTGSTVLAIHCHKPGEPPKILGTIDVSVVTGSKGWLCADQYYPAWKSPQFADTSWAPAVAYGKNGLNIPYGKVENISSSAKWIGTENGTDLYCRFSLCPQRGNALFKEVLLLICRALNFIIFIKNTSKVSKLPKSSIIMSMLIYTYQNHKYIPIQ